MPDWWQNIVIIQAAPVKTTATVSNLDRKLRRKEIKLLENRLAYSKWFLSKATIDSIEARLEWLELNWNEPYEQCDDGLCMPNKNEARAKDYLTPWKQRDRMGLND